MPVHDPFPRDSLIPKPGYQNVRIDIGFEVCLFSVWHISSECSNKWPEEITQGITICSHTSDFLSSTVKHIVGYTCNNIPIQIVIPMLIHGEGFFFLTVKSISTTPKLILFSSCKCYQFIYWVGPKSTHSQDITEHTLITTIIII